MSDRYLMSTLPDDQRTEIVRAICAETDREQFGAASEETALGTATSGETIPVSYETGPDVLFCVVMAAALLLALPVPVVGFFFLLGRLP